MHAVCGVYIYVCVCAWLGHDTEHRDVAADAAARSLVVLLGVCGVRARVYVCYIYI